MKILIIPDIHTRFNEAELIIEKEKPDNVVFIGDYFDAYGDSPEIAFQVAQWLKESLEKPNRLHLLGNHDLSYLDPKHPCSGFSQVKLFAIRSAKVDLSKLQHYCWVGDWLCTHAGLTRGFLTAYNHKNLHINDFLQDMLEHNKERLYDCSSFRGGVDAYSGIVWCDYNEFEDIPNVKQIFGHTKGSLRQTENHICIDTALAYYAVYEDGKMRVSRS